MKALTVSRVGALCWGLVCASCPGESEEGARAASVKARLPAPASWLLLEDLSQPYGAASPRDLLSHLSDWKSELSTFDISGASCDFGHERCDVFLSCIDTMPVATWFAVHECVWYRGAPLVIVPTNSGWVVGLLRSVQFVDQSDHSAVDVVTLVSFGLASPSRVSEGHGCRRSSTSGEGRARVCWSSVPSGALFDDAASAGGDRLVHEKMAVGYLLARLMDSTDIQTEMPAARALVRVTLGACSEGGLETLRSRYHALARARSHEPHEYQVEEWSCVGYLLGESATPSSLSGLINPCGIGEDVGCDLDDRSMGRWVTTIAMAMASGDFEGIFSQLGLDSAYSAACGWLH